jgi:hypothetical protein
MAGRRKSEIDPAEEYFRRNETPGRVEWLLHLLPEALCHRCRRQSGIRQRCLWRFLKPTGYCRPRVHLVDHRQTAHLIGTHQGFGLRYVIAYVTAYWFAVTTLDRAIANGAVCPNISGHRDVAVGDDAAQGAIAVSFRSLE